MARSAMPSAISFAVVLCIASLTGADAARKLLLSAGPRPHFLEELNQRTACTDPSIKDTAECLSVLEANAKLVPKPVRGFTPSPVPPVAPSPTRPPAPPGVLGRSVGSASGFIVVMAFGDGTRCYNEVHGHVEANVQHFGADTFLHTHGGLHGVGRCKPGAQGLALGLLTTEAFGEVVNRSNGCESTGESTTQLGAHVTGSGVHLELGGGFGVSGGCTGRRRV